MVKRFVTEALKLIVEQLERGQEKPVWISINEVTCAVGSYIAKTGYQGTGEVLGAESAEETIVYLCPYCGRGEDHPQLAETSQTGFSHFCPTCHTIFLVNEDIVRPLPFVDDALAKFRAD